MALIIWLLDEGFLIKASSRFLENRSVISEITDKKLIIIHAFFYQSHFNLTDFRFAMADGAWEMTRSMKEVFGDEVVRLMYWSHTNRNYTKKLKLI